MAKMGPKTGSNRLDAAMAQLIKNQAALVAQHTVFLSQMAEIRREFEEIRSVLMYHQRLLEGLPEAIKRTIGFKNK